MCEMIHYFGFQMARETNNNSYTTLMIRFEHIKQVGRVDEWLSFGTTADNIEA